MADLVPEFQKTVQQFRSKHGNSKVGEVTVDMVSKPHWVMMIFLVQLICIVIKGLGATGSKNVYQISNGPMTIFVVSPG